MFRASNFEFRFRFWIFGALFWIAFSSYSIDHQNAGAALVDWIAHLRGVHASDAAYRIAFFVAAAFCLAGAAVRTWGTAYLNPEIMVDGRMHSSRLVADGPYRYVRNPLYLGNILLAIGFGAMASRLGFVILIVGMILFVYRLILREEGGMLASQGERFAAFCGAVPRLLPLLRPKLPASGAKPDWGAGLLGEAFMWTMAASILAFAITLNLHVFWIVLVLAFVVYGACYAVIRARQKKKGGRTVR